MTFIQDSRVEQWLSHEPDITWSWQWVTIDQLDPIWKTVNLGRPDGEPIDEEIASGYVGLYTEEGSSPPGPMLWRPSPKDLFQVEDGAQRIFGWVELLKHPGIWAYVLECSRLKAEECRIIGNYRLQGKQPIPLEQTKKTIERLLIDRTEYNVETVAGMIGEKTAFVKAQLQQLQIRRKLTDVGVNHKITYKVIQGLIPAYRSGLFETIPKEIGKLVQILSQTRQTPTETEKLLRDTLGALVEAPNPKRSITRKLKQMQEDPTFQASKKPPSHRTTVDGFCNRALRGCRTFLSKESKKQSPAPILKEDLLKFRGYLDDIRSLLDTWPLSTVCPPAKSKTSKRKK